jgi:hypothetical protein
MCASRLHAAPGEVEKGPFPGNAVEQSSQTLGELLEGGRKGERGSWSLDGCSRLLSHSIEGENRADRKAGTSMGGFRAFLSTKGESRGCQVSWLWLCGQSQRTTPMPWVLRLTQLSTAPHTFNFLTRRSPRTLSDPEEVPDHLFLPLEASSGANSPAPPIPLLYPASCSPCPSSPQIQSVSSGWPPGGHIHLATFKTLPRALPCEFLSHHTHGQWGCPPHSSSLEHAAS